MPDDRVTPLLTARVEELRAAGVAKGDERVIRATLPAEGGLGPRLLLEGEGDRRFLRMNANNYLGMSFQAEVRAAEEAAVAEYGAGPGAVRFISGTWAPHAALEARLAKLHGREAAMIFSSAYATMLGVLPGLISKETVVISDALNHNCIINAVRLSSPAEKRIYAHNSMEELEACLKESVGKHRRAVVVTDGVFSMRGDFAPLDEVMALARRCDGEFPENVIVVVDDPHGVGALGATGRGTEEVTGSGASDLLVATLGKALGGNGGYVVGSRALVDYLRETAPTYIYSNPITPGEAAAAVRAVDILDSAEGVRLLDHLRAMTARFEKGLTDLRLETIPGPHPVVPLMVRDTAKTQTLVAHLFREGVLATGLAYPVVPKGDEEIRFQISADHTPVDIDAALAAIASA
jgi:glycine C-acetyltransferase